MPRVSPCFCFWLCSFHSFCLATMRRKMMAALRTTRSRHSCADTLLPQLGTLGLPALRKEFLKLHHLLSRGTEFGGHAAVADLEWVGPPCCGPPPGKAFFWSVPVLVLESGTARARKTSPGRPTWPRLPRWTFKPPKPPKRGHKGCKSRK